MTEDTNWLKKNPMMSLWRSSRFFGQDMDASVMANDQKSKNDVLVVSHMPRRSNIPIEKLKQMDFKFPAPVSRKGGGTKPVSRVTKFVVPQVSVSRPSMDFKSGENRSGMQKQGLVKSTGRPTVLSRPSRGGSNPSNVSTVKSRVVHRTPVLTGKLNQPGVKSFTDLSLLSQSKVVNQSTPKEETAVLRSILKQGRNGTKTCARVLLDGKNSAAAKRVNFNGNLKDNCQKENEKRDEGLFSTDQTGERLVERSSSQQKQSNCLTESDEESTAAFSTSFKSLPPEDVDCTSGNEENENTNETVRKFEVVDMDKVFEDGVKKKDSKTADSGKFINNLMNVWKAYHSKFSDIRNELHLVDETFQTTLKLIINNEIEDKLTLYEEEKAKLYEELKDLEVEFREKVKDCTQVKPLFLSYTERKKSILEMQSQLEEKFEKILHVILKNYSTESGFDIRKEEEAEKSSETTCVAVKTVKRISGAKRKSVCINGVKAKVTPRKRSSREVKVSGGITPDNTPARRRKLSRKIEKQIRNLFEE